MISGPNFSLTLHANVSLSVQWQQRLWHLQGGLCCEGALPAKQGVGHAAEASPAADMSVARLCRETKAWGLHPYLFVFFPGRKTLISITLRATVNI